MKLTTKGEGVNHLWEKTISVSILRTQTADREADDQGSMSKISSGVSVTECSSGHAEQIVKPMSKRERDHRVGSANY